MAISLFDKSLSLGRSGLRLHWLRGAGIIRLYERYIHEMLRQEPDLDLVGSNDLADDEIVRAVIACVGGLLGYGVRFLEDELMGFEKA